MNHHRTNHRTLATLIVAAAVSLSLVVGAAGGLPDVDAQTTTTTVTTVVPTTSPPAPTTTLGAQYFVRSVVAGSEHSCALMADGRVKCWGRNDLGQLGLGDTTNRQSAVLVTGLPAAAVLAAGGDHTCAITGVGDLYCWGKNTSGQLGDGTVTNRLRPVKINVGGPVAVLNAGQNHTCAARSTQLYCWGYNATGQLGTGDTAVRLTPTLVGLTSAPVVAIGAFTYDTCVQAGTGAKLSVDLACAGRNAGVWGNGTTAGGSSFVKVRSLPSPETLVLDGSTHRCRATPGAGVTACVGANGNGGLGDGTTTTRLDEVTVPGSFSTVTTGWLNFSCGFEQFAREYRCWGRNVEGQLGDGSTTGRTRPTPVSGLPVLTQYGGSIAAGRAHACAQVSVSGKADRIYCWGGDASGQLGNGSAASSSPVAARVSGI